MSIDECQCQHRWHFVKEESNIWELLDNGYYRLNPPVYKFICDICGKVKTIKEGADND